MPIKLWLLSSSTPSKNFVIDLPVTHRVRLLAACTALPYSREGRNYILLRICHVHRNGKCFLSLILETINDAKLMLAACKQGTLLASARDFIYQLIRDGFKYDDVLPMYNQVEYIRAEQLEKFEGARDMIVFVCKLITPRPIVLLAILGSLLCAATLPSRLIKRECDD